MAGVSPRPAKGLSRKDGDRPKRLWRGGGGGGGRALAPSRKFDPSHRDILMDPDRARYLDPKAILERFPIRSGDTVADIGSGPGFFTVPIAEIVGHQGRVYAIDVEEPMLAERQPNLAERCELSV